jgi:hypothetical protein
MLAGALTAAILALACLGYGFLDREMLPVWFISAGVSGLVASVSFLVWTIQAVIG